MFCLQNLKQRLRKIFFIKGDIIVEFDDQSVKTNTELSELITYTKKDQEVSIKVKRLENGNYVDKKFTVKMGKRPKEEKSNNDEKKEKEEKQFSKPRS